MGAQEIQKAWKDTRNVVFQVIKGMIIKNNKKESKRKSCKFFKLVKKGFYEMLSVP